MESAFWSWFALGLSFAIVIFGFWRNRNLSDRRKKEQNRRVGVAALFPLATLFLFPPYISESSPIDLQPELQEVTTTSTGELSKHSNKIAVEVNLLKREVKRLRQDLAEANNFYSRFVSMFAIGFLVFTALYPFTPNDRKFEPDVPRYPLGLNREIDD